MTLGSLFAGVGGFDLGFERAGMECRWQVEINPFRRAVLATHWPKVERYEDITKCGSRNLARVECITAGVPCQDWSVAGRMAGIEGSRSGLFFEFARILRELRPTWFVFENVPGLFSSNGGRDFAEVQRVLMVECGYGISWRVLNSQFFGVAQRRRRVYIVGCLGRPCPGEILFEPESSGGNPAKGEEPGAEVAAAVTGGIGRVGSRGADDGANIVANAITRNYGKQVDSSDRHGGPPNIVIATLNSGGNAGVFRTEPGEHIVIQDVRGGTRDKTDQGQGIGIREGGPSYTLSKTERHGVAFSLPSVHRGVGQGHNTNYVRDALTREGPGAVGYALRKDPGGTGQGHNTNYVRSPPDPNGVRDFAGLPKGMDSPRYQALGDAVTVQVAEWIAKRIIKANQTDA